MRSKLIACVLALSLTACAGMPERNVPDDVAGMLPDQFTDVLPTGDAEIPVEWWKAFDDPQLERLVERGLNYNSDLIIAAQRLREARAAFRSSRANQLPDIGVFIDGARERTPLVDPSDPVVHPTRRSSNRAAMAYRLATKSISGAAWLRRAKPNDNVIWRKATRWPRCV